jgi:acetyltransferase
LVSVIKSSEKPVLGVLMGDSLICEAVELFRAERIPDYRFPERAASTLAVLCERAEYLRRAEEEDVEFEEPEGICKEAARAAFDGFRSRHKGGLIPQGIARRILESYGIPFLPEGTAQSPEEASAISLRIGFPAALKIISPDIPHKSDVGGVRLDLKNEAEVEFAAIRMFEDIRRACPEAEVEGLLVQRMAPVGQEVIIGVVQDKQFGPLVMFGSGGAEVEGLKDIEFALAPVTMKEAARLMDSTWAGKKLYGYRNLPPADRNTVLESICRISLLAADFPEILEMEINPLRVMEEGKGAFALDVRLVAAKTL